MQAEATDVRQGADDGPAHGTGEAENGGLRGLHRYYLALPCQRSPPRIARPRPPRNSVAGSSAGSGSTGATCPGAGPAIPTRCSSPSSCCSRRRCRGSNRTGRGSWPGFPRWKRWHGRGRRRCGRAGRASATIDAPPTSTSWRASSPTSRRARSRRTPRRCGDCRASAGTPPAPWRASRSSGPSPRWIPTSHGCSDGRSTRGRAAPPASAGSGTPPPGCTPGTAARRGRSTRRSWNSGR